MILHNILLWIRSLCLLISVVVINIVLYQFMKSSLMSMKTCWYFISEEWNLLTYFMNLYVARHIDGNKGVLVLVQMQEDFGSNFLYFHFFFRITCKYISEISRICLISMFTFRTTVFFSYYTDKMGKEKQSVDKLS